MKVGFMIIDKIRNTSVVKEYENIKREYTLSPEKQQEIRIFKLSQFLSNIKNNKYYLPFMKDITTTKILKEPEKVLEGLPILSKNNIRKNLHLLLDAHIRTYEQRFTGGSTGQPLRYYISKKSLSRIKGYNYYLWNKYLGYNFGDKILVIGGTSLGANNNFKIKFYNYLQNKKFIDGDLINNTTIYDNLNSMISGTYDFLYGYPSSIEKYVDLALRLDKTLINHIKGVITTSEILENKVKLKFEKFFNVKVLNIYGANDGGVIGGSIDNEIFQYNYLDCFIQTKQNSIGKNELLLTDLNSEIFPFVNYNVEDIGNVESTSTYKFPNVIHDIEGRSRDIIINSRGDYFHGAVFNKIFKEYDMIERYQIIQNSDYSIDILFKINDMKAFNKEKMINTIIEIINDKKITVNILINQPFIQSINQKHKIVISNVI